MSLKKDELKILHAVVDHCYEELNVKDRLLTTNELYYVVTMAISSLATYKNLYNELNDVLKVKL